MLSYVIPLRRWEPADPDPLAEYLRWLAARADIVVADGSTAALFARHRETWGHLVRHVPVDPALVTANGKVGGVLTGVRLARHEKVVIADDDVRYDHAALNAMAALLERHDLVRPQNYFAPLTWPARWDTTRTLLNRALGQDFPGTLGIRRSTLTTLGGYDGDVVFENLELLRTVEVAGGRVAACPWLYVRRLPPPAAHFGRQQVRYAYESLAQPKRMALELGVVPGIAALLRTGRHRMLAGCVVATVAVAEAGRRRAGGRSVFPASSSPLAPAWLAVRGASSWVALSLRVTRGGLAYADTRIRTAAHSKRALRGRGPAGSRSRSVSP